MKLCLVGGIFGKSVDYQRTVQNTPETVLARGLRLRGHDVMAVGHHGPFAFDQFDVVHVHHLSWGAAIAAANWGRVPVVFTPHSHRVTRARRAAMSYVTGRASATVALSVTEAAWQRSNFPAVVGRQHIIANGIDPAVFFFSPPKPPAAGEPWRLLVVGQLIALKGVDVLLSSLGSWDRGRSVTLDLIYQVDRDETKLRAQADRLGLRVRFLGARTPEQLSLLYRESHVLVLPSLSEALPSVVTEAVFTGRPVVAFDVGAVREQIGLFGSVVAPGDSAALTVGLERVIDGYERLCANAAEASRSAVARYSVNAMVKAHEDLYESLRIGTAGRSAPSALDRLVLKGVPPLARLRGRR